MPEQLTFQPGARVWVHDPSLARMQRTTFPGRFERMLDDGRAEVTLDEHPIHRTLVRVPLRMLSPRTERIERLDPKEEPDRV